MDYRASAFLNRFKYKITIPQEDNNRLAKIYKKAVGYVSGYFTHCILVCQSLETKYTLCLKAIARLTLPNNFFVNVSKTEKDLLDQFTIDPKTTRAPISNSC